MRECARLAAIALRGALGLMLLGSCASTSMLASQKNPAYTGPELKRLMVVAVAANPQVRRVFEDEFVTKLRVAGVTAVPSYPLLSDSGAIDQTQLRKAVESAGMDGILAARLVRVEQQQTALQAFNFVDRSAGFYAYYSSDSEESSASSLTVGSDPITIHFDLYSVAGSQLVWAGDAATFPSTDVQQITAGLAYTIIPTLKKQKLV